MGKQPPAISPAYRHQHTAQCFPGKQGLQINHSGNDLISTVPPFFAKWEGAPSGFLSPSPPFNFFSCRTPLVFRKRRGTPNISVSQRCALRGSSGMTGGDHSPPGPGAGGVLLYKRGGVPPVPCLFMEGRRSSHECICPGSPGKKCNFLVEKPKKTIGSKSDNFLKRVSPKKARSETFSCRKGS